MKPPHAKSNHFSWLWCNAESGSAFASIVVVVACLKLGGCLILDRHEASEEPNYPPSIVSAANAEHPLGEIVRLESNSDVLEEVFEIVVRDANINQTLDYRVFLDRIPTFPLNGLIEQSTIEPNGSLDRPSQFTVGRDTLAAKPCTKVEFIVAGEFETTDNVPIVEGDIASAVWWVTSVETLNLADCVQ
jgi:hypothetical protein